MEGAWHHAKKHGDLAQIKDFKWKIGCGYLLPINSGRLLGFYQANVLSLIISQFSVINFHYCLQSDVTAKLLGLASEPY